LVNDWCKRCCDRYMLWLICFGGEEHWGSIVVVSVA
jgi:hypothetical protein